MLSPTEQIQNHFASDRSAWNLLSLQNRLKEAKTDETRAVLATKIQDTIRTLTLLYTDIHMDFYRQGVKFAEQNAHHYVIAEQLRQNGHRVSVRNVNGRPAMSVNGRCID